MAGRQLPASSQWGYGPHWLQSAHLMHSPQDPRRGFSIFNPAILLRPTSVLLCQLLVQWWSAPVMLYARYVAYHVCNGSVILPDHSLC